MRHWINALTETEEIDEARKKRATKTRRKKSAARGGTVSWYSDFVGSGDCGGDAVTESEDDEPLTLHQQFHLAWVAAQDNPTPENIAEFKRLRALWNEEGRREREQADAERAAAAQTAPPAADGYRGEHEAPDRTNGAPLHNLTGTGLFPDDFYGPNGADYYSQEDPRAYYGVAVFRNRPNAPVKVYRAVPKDPAIRKINPGDWVTPFRRYAVEHGRDHLRNDFRIITKTVRARDLFTDGNSLLEWGYDPPNQE